MDQEFEGAQEAQLTENKELVHRIATDQIEPALQEALKKAKDEANSLEILSAFANSYGGFLVDMMGHAAAAKFMRAHADHIASREELAIKDEKH